MKTHLFLLSFLFCAQLCFSQKNGPFEEYHDNGKLKISGQYKNNKRVGEWKEYYENGSVFMIYSYKKGRRNKETKTFFEGGNLKFETKKIGEGKFASIGYFEDGALFFEQILPKGSYKEYYNSGELKIESVYNNDDIFGVWKEFSKEGNIKWEVDHVDGYKHGVYKQYHSNGKLKIEGTHKMNKKNGKENHYDGEGNLIHELKYRKGKLLKSNDGISKEVKVPDGIINHAPVYPKCEKFLGNIARKKCMNAKITEFVNLNYNTGIAQKYGVPGDQKIKIHIIFTVDKKGNVTDVKARSAHPKFTEEAIRVGKMLPKMKPSIQRGKLIDVSYSLPIVFYIGPKEGYNKN